MTEDKELPSKNQIQEEELDLIARVKRIWVGRRKIIKITLVFAFIGVFIAVFSEKEYTASTTIVPQVSSGKNLLGNSRGLAAIAGINLEGSSANDSGISPILYPHIINSVSFQKELLATPLTIKGYDNPVTFQEYYSDIYRPGLLSIIKKYTIGLPGVLFGEKNEKSTKLSLKTIDVSKKILRVTAAEKTIMKQLKKQIVLSINEKEGYVSLYSTMPDALNAAELTQNVQELLQQYIIDFKIKKSKDQLKFIKDRYHEKEAIYKETQTKLASFQDRNQFMNSALAKNTQSRYQAEYDLAFGVYSELAKQLETQQIKVKEETPVFTILERVSIPLDHSKPKRAWILFLWTFLGFIIGVAIVFSENYITQFLSKMRKD